MPLKVFQENFWNLSDTTVPPPSIAGEGGYPGWQASVVGSLFGALGDQMRAAWAKWRWIWTLVRRIRGLDRDRQLVMQRTLDTLEAPAFVLASQAVRETARQPGFHRPEAWRSLSHLLKADPGQSENLYRHFRTVNQLQLAAREAGSTLSNPQLHFSAELAYQSFAIKGR